MFASESEASKKASDSNGDAKKGQEEAGSKGEGEAAADAEQVPAPTIEDLQAQVKDKEAAALKLADQVEQLTDALKRSLAEMENVRMRTSREVDNAKKFAVQGFVKSLLDVVDNLERAAGVVPADALSPEKVDPEKLRALLKGLLEGVQATEKIMLSVLKRHGVEQYNPVGDKFDPNLHAALFEVPDPSKEVGTVAVVSKRGYKLHDRIIRPADVGVVRSA